MAVVKAASLAGSRVCRLYLLKTGPE